MYNLMPKVAKALQLRLFEKEPCDFFQKIIYDIMDDASAGGFGHPECADAATEIGNGLPESHPIGE